MPLTHDPRPLSSHDPAPSRNPPPVPVTPPTFRESRGSTILGVSAYESWRITREEEDRVYRVLETIPRFDPSVIPFEEFATAIESVRKRIPAGYEDRFLEGLIGKLFQPIQFYVEESGCNSVAELLKLLRKRYAPNRTHQEIRYDLEHMTARPSESMLEYIHRFTRSFHQAKVSARDEMGENFDFAALDRLARKSFIRGLPLHLSYAVIAAVPGTLEEAMDEALYVEKCESKRMFPVNHHNLQPLPPRPPAPCDYNRSWTEYIENRRNIRNKNIRGTHIMLTFASASTTVLLEGLTFISRPGTMATLTSLEGPLIRNRNTGPSHTDQNIGINLSKSAIRRYEITRVQIKITQTPRPGGKHRCSSPEGPLPAEDASLRTGNTIINHATTLTNAKI